MKDGFLARAMFWTLFVGGVLIFLILQGCATSNLVLDEQVVIQTIRWGIKYLYVLAVLLALLGTWAVSEWRGWL